MLFIPSPGAASGADRASVDGRARFRPHGEGDAATHQQASTQPPRCATNGIIVLLVAISAHACPRAATPDEDSVGGRRRRLRLVAAPKGGVQVGRDQSLRTGIPPESYDSVAVRAGSDDDPESSSAVHRNAHRGSSIAPGGGAAKHQVEAALLGEPRPL